jgi:hypothetical protein
VWPNVEEQVAVEQTQIDRLFEAYQAGMSKSLQLEPDFIELSDLAAVLHYFYTGVGKVRRIINREGASRNILQGFP